MIFESHAHYEDKKFDADRVELLSSMREHNIGTIVNVGSSLQTSALTMELAKRNKDVYAAIGVHPEVIVEMSEPGMLWLRTNAKFNQKVVAIGEIGLDYYWEKEPEVQEKQRYWFIEQLKLARELEMPVIIHSRDAAEDTMKIMKEYAVGLSGVIHCFSYSPEIAREYVKMGFYIGVGGVVTFKNAKKLVETVEQIPLERILVETDCPYMAPEPHRGSRNSSLEIPYIIDKIAEIKGITAKEVELTTEANAKQMYRIDQ